jgi:superoxide dismutase
MKQQTANSKQQTANSKQQTANSKQQTMVCSFNNNKHINHSFFGNCLISLSGSAKGSK